VVLQVEDASVDGAGCCRAHELDPALPVIAVTAFILSSRRWRSGRAFDYLPKNFSVDQLRGRGWAPPPPDPARENRSQNPARPDLRARQHHRPEPTAGRIFELVRKAARSRPISW
jgi:hypothetical protein